MQKPNKLRIKNDFKTYKFSLKTISDADVAL